MLLLGVGVVVHHLCEDCDLGHTISQPCIIPGLILYDCVMLLLVLVCSLVAGACLGCYL